MWKIYGLLLLTLKDVKKISDFIALNQKSWEKDQVSLLWILKVFKNISLTAIDHKRCKKWKFLILLLHITINRKSEVSLSLSTKVVKKSSRFNYFCSLVVKEYFGFAAFVHKRSCKNIKFLCFWPYKKLWNISGGFSAVDHKKLLKNIYSFSAFYHKKL